MKRSNTTLSAVARGIVEDTVKRSAMGSGLYVVFDIDDFGSGHLVKVSHTYQGVAKDKLSHDWRLVFVTYDPNTSTARVIWSQIC